METIHEAHEIRSRNRTMANAVIISGASQKIVMIFRTDMKSVATMKEAGMISIITAREICNPNRLVRISFNPRSGPNTRIINNKCVPYRTHTTSYRE